MNTNKVNLFNEKIQFNSEIKRFRHDRRYLNEIGVRQLNYVAVHDMTRNEINSCLEPLLRHTDPKFPMSDLALFMVYTTTEEESLASISTQETCAFSLFYASNGDHLEHRFFEKQEEGRFRQVDSLSTTLTAAPDLDDIRLLHFGATSGERSLPAVSSIYEFRAQGFSSLRFANKNDHSLRKALLSDGKRSPGAMTVGLYGNDLWAMLVDDDNLPGGSCGQLDSCLSGQNPCTQDPIAGYACKQDSGGDGCAAVSAALRAFKIPLIKPIDPKPFRKFCSNFLLNYQKGRDYISYYYLSSLFVKKDPASLLSYFLALPHMDKAMARLTSGPDDAVIVTPDLQKTVQALVDSHRDIEDPAFQEVLNVIERDFNSFLGMSKKRVIAELESQTPYN